MKSAKVMWYVYILLCIDKTYYTGCTSKIEERLKRHNTYQVAYTSTCLPVQLICYITFANKFKAYEFEKYLKSGSGRAFAKKHFI
jgi:predicted GIY-YIG superfamily endonuclease